MACNGEYAVHVPFGTLLPAVFRERPNRFVGIIEIDGQLQKAHIMDSGRLEELLIPGNTVMVRKATDTKSRRTAYDVVLAFHGSTLVSVDTRYPNLIMEKALRSRVLPEFHDYREVFREVSVNHILENVSENTPCEICHHVTNHPFVRESSREHASAADESLHPGPHQVVSRLDFALRGEKLSPALVEVKSVTLAQGKKGLFPDAPTERGTRHLHELIRAKEAGYSPYVVFIAQRGDIEAVSPNWKTDPTFARTLLEAVEKGVTLLAYGCQVTKSRISLSSKAIPVVLTPDRTLD